MSRGTTKLSAEIFPVAGVQVGAVGAGIRYADRLDLALLEVPPGTECAAVFTRNAFCAAPVSVAREHLAAAQPRYLVINAGNANAGTGQGGLEDARAVCRAVAESTGCRPQEVLPFSTGVIGERLPLERLLAGLPGLVSGLGPDGWSQAARAIMTTDTGPKAVSRRFDVAAGTVSVTGIAKGAGMIKPDMATMLAFVATDARVERSVLQRCLQDVVQGSFNAITVDGDTSTNDACVLLASGASGVSMGTDGAGWPAFREAIEGVCTELAQAIVRDGEGATKFITIQVEQGRSVAECRQVAYTVAHSPLVKTAFFASDPNWGRILAAVGRAGLDGLRTDPVVIFLDDLCIVRHGGRAEEYTEERGRQVMSRDAISVRIQLGRGDAVARVWTTDLSYDYVRINADYRS